MLLLLSILWLTVILFQQQNQIPHDKDNAAAKNDDAEKQDFNTGGVGAACNIAWTTFASMYARSSRAVPFRMMRFPTCVDLFCLLIG